MTLAAESLPPEADPAVSPAGMHHAGALDALCRTARRLFDVAAAAITLGDTVRYHLAVADEGARDVWSGVVAAIGYPGHSDGIIALSPSVSGRPAAHVVATIGFGECGWLILLDDGPRRLGAAEEQQLADLATFADTLCRLEGRLRDAERQEEHFRLLAESSTDTIVRGSLDGVRLYISPAVRELLGYEPEELIGRRALDITHVEDMSRLRGLMDQLRQGTLTIGRSEQRQRHKDGSWVWLESHLRLTYDKQTGQPDGYVASVRGMDDRKAIEARLEHLATHDELTGLPNRKLFRDHLTAAIDETRRGGRRFALLWMDLDRFKDINDSLGHQAGDAVLRMATERFRTIIRSGDMVARLGGDEFALIAPIGPDNSEAGAIAARLVATMEQPILHGGRALTVGLSIGIACTPEAGRDPDELLAAADKALYVAKSSGRGGYCFCAASAPPD